MRRPLRSNHERRHKEEGGTYIMRDRRNQDPRHRQKPTVYTTAVFLLSVSGPDYCCCVFPCNDSMYTTTGRRKKYNTNDIEDETVIFTCRVSMLHVLKPKTSHQGIYY